MQLVELKPLRVNESLAPGERDDAENGGSDDDEDDEEDGAFPLNGSKLSRGGYLHIIPRNSPMCLIRRYLSVRLADATTSTTYRSPLAVQLTQPLCFWRSLRSQAAITENHWISVRKHRRLVAATTRSYIDVLPELILLRFN